MIARFRACFFGVASLLALSVSTSWSAPAVTGMNLVSSVRSGRTTFDYTYQLQIANPGNPFSNVKFAVSSTAAGTTVLTPTVYVSFIPAAGTTITNSLFTLRQDRRYPFSFSSLVWSVTGNEIIPNTQPVTIQNVNFVSFEGTPEHGGLLPIGRAPTVTASNSAQLEVDLTGPIVNGKVDLISPTGLALVTAPLSPFTRVPNILGDYLASLAVPNSPFSVRASGIDSLGRPFSQTWPLTFFPTNVNLAIGTLTRSAVAGSTLVVPLIVTNFGADQAFTVLAVSQSANAIPQSNALLVPTIVSGQSLSTQISVSIAAGAQPFDDYDINLSVIGATDNTIDNHIKLTVEVAPTAVPEGVF